MSTRVEFRWPDDLVAAVDKARGSEPRSAFVRRHIEQRVKVEKVVAAPTPEAIERIKTMTAKLENRNAPPPPTFDPSDAL